MALFFGWFGERNNDGVPLPPFIIGGVTVTLEKNRHFFSFRIQGDDAPSIFLGKLIEKELNVHFNIVEPSMGSNPVSIILSVTDKTRKRNTPPFGKEKMTAYLKDLASKLPNSQTLQDFIEYDQIRNESIQKQHTADNVRTIVEPLLHEAANFLSAKEYALSAKLKAQLCEHLITWQQKKEPGQHTSGSSPVSVASLVLEIRDFCAQKGYTLPTPLQGPLCDHLAQWQEKKDTQQRRST